MRDIIRTGVGDNSLDSGTTVRGDCNIEANLAIPSNQDIAIRDVVSEYILVHVVLLSEVPNGVSDEGGPDPAVADLTSEKLVKRARVIGSACSEGIARSHGKEHRKHELNQELHGEDRLRD